MKKILLISMLMLFGCGEKSHYMFCDGYEYSNTYNFTTGEPIKSKEKRFNSDVNITVRKNIYGYSIDSTKCIKDKEGNLECGDGKCFSSYMYNFAEKPSCKEKMWGYTSFDTMSGSYSIRTFLPIKKDNEYILLGANYDCTEVKKAIED
jgi:hypothetical protein